MRIFLSLVFVCMLASGCCTCGNNQDQNPHQRIEPNLSVDELYNLYMNRRLAIMGAKSSEHAKVLNLTQQLLEVSEQVKATKEISNKKNMIIDHAQPIEFVLNDNTISHQERALRIKSLVKKDPHWPLN